MLMLRATYARELASGMGEAEVARRLPAVLERLHRRGGPARPVLARDADRAFADAIDTALTEERGEALRRRAAARAAAVVAGEGGAREGFALYVLGRLSLGPDPAAAARAFDGAAAIYAADPRTRPHEGHVAVQRAALALRRGAPEEALALARGGEEAARRGQNAALLATLGFIEAEALGALGRPGEARDARMDSLGWARYGFGPDEAVRARLAEVASLGRRAAPPPKEAGS